MDHRSFFENSPDLLCAVDRDGRFVDVSPSWERALGFTQDELRGQSVVDFVAANEKEAVAAALERTRAAEATKRDGDGKLHARFAHKDGSIRSLAWSGAFVPGDDVIVASAHDVTEQRAEAHVRQLRTLMSSTSDLIALINLGGKVTYMNPAGLTMLGRRTSDAEPIRLTDFLHEEGSRSFPTTIRPIVLRDGLWAGELTLFGEGGRAIPVSMVIILIRDEEGEPEVIGIIARDLTEHKAMEAALKLAIRAMSTPIIQIWDGVLALPVIGTVDSARAAQMTEALLDSIVTTRCKVAIIDLTGVDVVDTATVNHLFKMVSAASLLGSSCLVSGISPHVAQTVASLGVDFSRLQAFGTLQEALRFAIGAQSHRR